VLSSGKVPESNFSVLRCNPAFARILQNFLVCV
jgi:hypothetical protein